MLAIGFLETCTSSFIEGWVYTDDPLLMTPVEVEILHCGEVIGHVKAELFRKDIAEAGYGSGDNGFHFIIPAAARGKGPSEFSARLLLSSGDYYYLERSSICSSTLKQDNYSLPVHFIGSTTDSCHHPLFILGSARSGTSALTRSLLDCLDYEGEEEGHFFEIAAYFQDFIERFYTSKHDELDRSTTISRVPRQYVVDSFRFTLIQSANQLYPTRKWLDKTPNANMIYIAPFLLEIWPNARFIFLKRRAIENLLSRRQKFKNSFQTDCLEWAECMKAWNDVINQIDQSSIELEQYDMLKKPAKFAKDVGGFLDLSDIEIRRIEVALTQKRTQQSERAYPDASIEDLHLNSEEMDHFLLTCGELMKANNYSYDSSYYRQAEQ